MRLGKNANNPVFCDLATDFCDTGWARIRGITDRNRPGCRKIKIRLKILIGIMEHNEFAAPHWIKRRFNLLDEGFNRRTA